MMNHLLIPLILNNVVRILLDLTYLINSLGGIKLKIVVKHSFANNMLIKYHAWKPQITHAFITKILSNVCLRMKYILTRVMLDARGFNQ